MLNKKKRNCIYAFFVATIVFVQTILSVFLLPISALEGAELENDTLSVTTSGLNTPETVNVGWTGYDLSFVFNSIKKQDGGTYYKGETFIIPSNIGELFDTDWGNLVSKIYNSEKVLIATVTVLKNGFKVTVEDGGVGETGLSGEVVVAPKLKAIAEGSSDGIIHKLDIGDQSSYIVFKTPQDVSGLDPRVLDRDSAWKWGWSTNNATSAAWAVGINMEASVQLYNNLGELPVEQYKNFDVVLEDLMPLDGIINPKDIIIYAVRPTRTVAQKGNQGNGKFQPGEVYASEGGSQWIQIQNHAKVKYLEQQTDETYDEFKARLADKPEGVSIQWGIYNAPTTLPDGTESTHDILVVNFGHLPGNGFTFMDLASWLYSGDYNKLIGPDNSIGGQVLTYRVEIAESNYPSATGKITVTNHAKISGSGVREASANLNFGGGAGVGVQEHSGLPYMMRTPRQKIQQMKPSGNR